jgi:hypothetical protein
LFLDIEVSVGDQLAHVGSGFLASGAGHEAAFRTSAAILQVPDLTSSTDNTFLSVPSSSLGAGTLKETWIPALATCTGRVRLTTVSFSDSTIRTGSVGHTSVVSPAGGGRTLLREGLALVSLFVVAIGTVSSVGNTGSTVPLGTFGTGVREIDALFTIVELPGQASFAWVGADTVGAVEERIGWASEVDAGLTIPTLVGGTSGVAADLLGGKEDEAGRTAALVDEGVVDLVVDAPLNGLAVGAVEPLVVRTSAYHELGVPNETVDAGSLRRYTQVVKEDLVTWADAGLGEVVPNLAAQARVGHTVEVGPDSGGRALA